MFRTSTLGGFLLLATIAVSTIAEEPAEKKLAELKWAKEVASDFLDAAFAGKLEQAEALLDASLKASFTAQGENRLSEHLNNTIAIRGFHSPMFRSETMAPDQDEASFKGSFSDEKKQYRFSLRVVKNKESGKWRVSYFHFSESEAEETQPPKAK